jgi:hypothetical protein
MKKQNNSKFGENMITVVSKRKDVNTTDPRFGFVDTFQRTTEQALISLAEYELGFGGRIDSITENDGIFTVTTIAQVMSKVDTTIFSGSKAEMEPLLKVCAAVITVQTKYNRELVDSTIKLLGKSAGVPLILSLAGPMFMGETSVKTSLLVILGIQPGTDLFDKLKKQKIKDICLAWSYNDWKSEGVEGWLL